MMNLLKYDFKRNAMTILGVMAVLILTQVSMMIFIHNETILVGLTILAYIIAGVILFITPIRTFSHNLKAYHRKLLPVHTLKGILSPIVMGGLSLLGLGIIAAVHGSVYLSIYGNIDFMIDLIRSTPLSTITLLLSAIWTVIHVLVVIFLSVTIATSIRGKGGTWIGIVSFFILVYGLSGVESILFGNFDGGIFDVVALQMNESVNGVSTNMRFNPMDGYGGMIGVFIFELVCSVVFMYIMVKLIDRKVEV